MFLLLHSWLRGDPKTPDIIINSDQIQVAFRAEGDSFTTIYLAGGRKEVVVEALDDLNLHIPSPSPKRRSKK